MEVGGLAWCQLKQLVVAWEEGLGLLEVLRKVEGRRGGGAGALAWWKWGARPGVS